MRELAGMFRTLVILVTLGLLVCYAGSCGLHATNQAMWTDASGRPLDYAGNLRKCPHCMKGIGYHQQGYVYRCDGCDRVFVARLVNGGRDVQFGEPK